MKQKIIDKIKLLIKEGHRIEYLKNGHYSQNRMRIDKITLEQNQITFFEGGSEKNKWEWFVYVSFMNNPILSEKEAEEVKDFIVGENKNLLDKYLEVK